MNIDDITVLSVTFNNDLLTGYMLKSLNKQLGFLPKVCIVDNGNKIQCSDEFKSVFNVIDNFNHKLLPDEMQASRNHAAAIDYALKNCIKTKWCLLVDNDVLFKPEIKEFLFNLKEDYDVYGEIGLDCTPPDRLFPYFCLINVEKFKKEKLNYFDRNRTISLGMNGNHGSKYNKYDTGYSFYEDIKNKWKINNFKLNNYIDHLKSGMLARKNIFIWLYNNENLWK